MYVSVCVIFSDITFKNSLLCTWLFGNYISVSGFVLVNARHAVHDSTNTDEKVKITSMEIEATEVFDKNKTIIIWPKQNQAQQGLVHVTWDLTDSKNTVASHAIANYAVAFIRKLK